MSKGQWKRENQAHVHRGPERGLASTRRPIFSVSAQFLSTSSGKPLTAQLRSVSLPPRRRCPNAPLGSTPGGVLRPAPQAFRRTRALPAPRRPARPGLPPHPRAAVPHRFLLALPMTRTNGASAGGGQQASGKLPRKRFYRARAHSNPLSDSHFPVPVSPDEFDLSQHYPRYFPADKGGDEAAAAAVAAPRIHFADVGCGFGGLLVGLSPLFPDTLMIGMELRDKVMISCSP
jgi:hypothetical protein